MVEFNLTPNLNKEQMINKLLEYKPYNYNNNSSSIKYLQENTNKIITSLSSPKKPIYISCLLELNKFNTLTLFDDMKINIIYVYYSNYYNYILNINDIRQYFMQNNSINIIPKNMRNKDNFTIFKFLSKRIRITSNDYITDKYYKTKDNNIYSNKYRNENSSNKNRIYKENKSHDKLKEVNIIKKQKEKSFDKKLNNNLNNNEESKNNIYEKLNVNIVWKNNEENKTDISPNSKISNYSKEQYDTKYNIFTNNLVNV